MSNTDYQPRILILKGSPRPQGNTAAMVRHAAEEWERQGALVREIDLAALRIAPCRGCYHCQDVAGRYGCVIEDDMQPVVDAVLWANVFVLATPIYTWYCTAEMKAVLDRFFGMNKYYRTAPYERLWAGRSCAIIATCGYEPEDGAGPFEAGIRRLCEHSGLSYLGMVAHRDLDDLASFTTEEARARAAAFARAVMADIAAMREQTNESS